MIIVKEKEYVIVKVPSESFQTEKLLDMTCFIMSLDYLLDSGSIEKANDLSEWFFFKAVVSVPTLGCGFLTGLVVK
jgi:hypothetical protein